MKQEGQRKKGKDKLWYFTNGRDYENRIENLLLRYPRQNPYNKANWINWEMFPTPDGWQKYNNEIDNPIYQTKNDIYWWLKTSIFPYNYAPDDLVIDTEILINTIRNNFGLILTQEDLVGFIYTVQKHNHLTVCDEKGYRIKEELTCWTYNNVRFYGKDRNKIKAYIVKKYNISAYTTNKKYHYTDFCPHYNFLNYDEFCGIYKITNTQTNQCYVGQSVNIIERWEQHIKGNTTKLGKAFKDYGLENFTFEILEECSPLYLDIKEFEYIEKYDAYTLGYNSTRGNVNKVKMYKEWLLKHASEE